MKYFRIGTLNCQNNADNRNLKQKENALVLANHIVEKQYDILGTQELTKGFTRQVNEYLEIYTFHGGYQFGSGFFGTKVPIIRDYNESTQILTRGVAEHVRTGALPWIPWNFKEFCRALFKGALKRRIVTVVELETIEHYIYIINTHLDYYLHNLQKRQLNYLYKKAKKYAALGDVVIMGDFNLQITNPMFRHFENKLNEIGIRRVNVDEKTNSAKYKSKTAIDHIFIPSYWKIVDCGTFDTLALSEITDHKAVYVDVVFWPEV